MKTFVYVFNEPVEVFFVADLHYGDTNSKYETAIKWLKNELRQPNKFVAFVGDIIDNALKDSVANVYKQAKSPHEQLERFAKDISDIREKILCMVSGNHEDRTEKQVGINILQLICELYSINFSPTYAILDININSANGVGLKKRFSYSVAIHHGIANGRYPERSLKQTRMFEEVIFGCDAYVTAHTHENAVSFQKKMFYDAKNKTIQNKTIIYATVGGFVDPEYAEKKLLRPTQPAFVKLRFEQTEKKIIPSVIPLQIK